MQLRVHDVERASRANGPGRRFVVWLQGCTLDCPGCFNPATHAAGGRAIPVGDLVAEITGAGVDGLTLSGGEPMQQAEGVLALLEAVRRTPLSTLMFSGYTIEELRTQPLGPPVLAHLDVLIDGRYRARERLGTGLRGSSNQRIHCLTGRYTVADVEATPEAAIRIAPDGSIVVTGVKPLRID